MSKRAFGQKAPGVNGLTKYIVQIMKCNSSCKLKTNKNERVIWGIEFGLTEMCFPSPGLRHKYKLTMAASLLFSLQIMGRGPWAPSLDLPLFSYIGRCPENSFDNLNITPQYVKRIAMTFSFCWLII